MQPQYLTKPLLYHEQASEMINNLQQAFDELLDHLDWMDEETKEVAKDKVSLGFNPSLPDSTVIGKLKRESIVCLSQNIRGAFG